MTKLEQDNIVMASNLIQRIIRYSRTPMADKKKCEEDKQKAINYLKSMGVQYE